MNFKCALSLLLASALLDAYTLPSPAPSCEPEQVCVCCEEPLPGPFAYAYPKDLRLNCSKDFYLHADVLLFQAKQDGMEFVMRNDNGVSLPIVGGDVLGFSHNHKDYGYQPGLRLGLGFYVHHDAWYIDFDWTWLNITNYKHYTAQDSGILLPLWITPLNPDPSWGSVGAAWDTHYNSLDASLGKPYHVSSQLILNPHFGLRAGWIDQNFSVHYAGTFNASPNGTVHDGSNDFWGVGARAGLKSEWILGKGWNFFGNIAAALLFGHFNVDQNLAIGAGAANQGFYSDYEFYQNVPNMEIQLGIAWNKYLSKRRYRIGLAFSYEFHEWWDQLNMRRFYGTTTSTTAYEWQNDTVSRGNFTMNGFNFGISLDL